MTKVDSKGRIVLPQDVRGRLGITPGTEVDVREEDGRVIVEPEEDPDEIIERMERLIGEAAADRDLPPATYEEMHPIAQNHADTIRRGAQETDADDE